MININYILIASQQITHNIENVKYIDPNKSLAIFFFPCSAIYTLFSNLFKQYESWYQISKMLTAKSLREMNIETL